MFIFQFKTEGVITLNICIQQKYEYLGLLCIRIPSSVSIYQYMGLQCIEFPSFIMENGSASASGLHPFSVSIIWRKYKLNHRQKNTIENTNREIQLKVQIQNQIKSTDKEIHLNHNYIEEIQIRMRVISEQIHTDETGYKAIRI